MSDLATDKRDLADAQNTPSEARTSAGPEVSPDSGGSPQKKKLNARRKKRIRTLIIALAVILIAGGAIAYGVVRLFFTPEKVYPLTGFVYRGSLMNQIQGYGTVKPVDSADIAVKQSGTVLEVYAMVDAMVSVGDPLFLMDGSLIDKAITDVEKEIEGLEKEIADIEKEIAAMAEENENLRKGQQETFEGTVLHAPFSGKLVDAPKHKIGDALQAGDALGLFIDDSVMKLTLYFSYAYENDIARGMQADISIPQSMSVLKGTVERVEKIRRVTSQGTVLFEVEFSVANPGALTKGMEATATLKAANGELIIPAESGALEYREEETLFLTTGGRVTVYNIRDYYEYQAGDVLAQVEYIKDDSKLEANLQAIENKYLTIEGRQESIAQKRESIAQQRLLYDELLVVSPIDGTVRYNRAVVGEKVDPGAAVVSVVNTQSMIVEAQIDERDVNSVYSGLMVNLEQWTNEGPQYFMGVIDSVSMEGKNEWGVTYFPAVIKVDNFGTLRENMGINFTANTDERYDILVAPVEAVKNTSLGNMLFIKADEPPEGALPPEGIPDNIILPDGFYAVPVECGMGNTSGIEILSGAYEGAEVYLQDVDYDPNADMGGNGDMGGADDMGGKIVRVG